VLKNLNTADRFYDYQTSCPDACLGMISKDLNAITVTLLLLF